MQKFMNFLLKFDDILKHAENAILETWMQEFVKILLKFDEILTKFHSFINHEYSNLAP